MKPPLLSKEEDNKIWLKVLKNWEVDLTFVFVLICFFQYILEVATNVKSSHQFSLDGEDPLSGRLTVALPARDDDHLRVTVLCRQVDLSGGLFPDLA